MEEKLDSIVTRLQKAEDPQMEIEKFLDDDSQVGEVDTQARTMVRYGKRTNLCCEIMVKKQPKAKYKYKA